MRKRFILFLNARVNMPWKWTDPFSGGTPWNRVCRVGSDTEMLYYRKGIEPKIPSVTSMI
jgi:hypothetical protein